MQERITLEKERLVRDLRTRLVDLNERRESEEVRSPLITLYIYISCYDYETLFFLSPSYINDNPYVCYVIYFV